MRDDRFSRSLRPIVARAFHYVLRGVLILACLIVSAVWSVSLVFGSLECEVDHVDARGVGHIFIFGGLRGDLYVSSVMIDLTAFHVPSSVVADSMGWSCLCRRFVSNLYNEDLAGGRLPSTFYFRCETDGVRPKGSLDRWSLFNVGLKSIVTTPLMTGILVTTYLIVVRRYRRRIMHRGFSVDCTSF